MAQSEEKSFCRLPPDEDSLRHQLQQANHLAYLLRNPSLRDHPSPVGNGWELVNGICRPVRYSKPARLNYLRAYDSCRNDDELDANNNDSHYGLDPVCHDDDDDDNDDEYDDDDDYDESELHSESGASDNQQEDVDFTTDEDFSDAECD